MSDQNTVSLRAHEEAQDRTDQAHRLYAEEARVIWQQKKAQDDEYVRDMTHDYVPEAVCDLVRAIIGEETDNTVLQRVAAIRVAVKERMIGDLADIDGRNELADIIWEMFNDDRRAA